MYRKNVAIIHPKENVSKEMANWIDELQKRDYGHYKNLDDLLKSEQKYSVIVFTHESIKERERLVDLFKLKTPVIYICPKNDNISVNVYSLYGKDGLAFLPTEGKLLNNKIERLTKV